MLDGKVLTAVLASVAAIAAAISGGGINAEAVKDSTVSAPGDSSFNSLIPESVPFVGDFLKNPQPENEVEAYLKYEDFEEDQSFTVRSASLKAENLSKFNLGARTVFSREKPVFRGFSGQIKPRAKTLIKGSASGFNAGGVNLSGTFKLKKEFATSHISLRGVKRSSLNIERVTGTISSNSSSTEIKEATEFDVNSFTGSIDVYPGNRTLLLDGKVAELKAGAFSFGN